MLKKLEDFFSDVGFFIVQMFVISLEIFIELKLYWVLIFLFFFYLMCKQ